MKRISKTEIKEMRSQSKKNSIMFAFTLPTVILYTIFFLVTMLIIIALQIGMVFLKIIRLLA